MKKLLQLLLALTMARPAAYAEKNKTFNYVSFGDSQTAGLGLHGCVPEWFYEDPSYYWTGTNPITGEKIKSGYFASGYYFQSEDSYPRLIEKALQREYKNVNFKPAAINAFRAETLKHLLYGEPMTHVYDQFMASDYIGGSEAERHETYTINGKVYTYDKAKTSVSAEMISAVENADLITYDLGANDFGGFFMFGSFAAYLEKYGIKVTDLYELIPAEYADIYYSTKGYILNMILESAGEAIPAELLSSLTSYVDMFVYSLVSFIVNFDATMERIYTLNPDVEVVVMSIQNIYKDAQAAMGDMVLPLGDIIGVLMTIANAYTSFFSPYANKYYYVDFGNEHVHDHIDELETWSSQRSFLNNSLTRYAELERLMGYGEIIDSFNVYSELLVEYTLKNEIAARENVIVGGKQLTFDEIVNSNSYALRSIKNRIQKELAVKTKLSYYAHARAFVCSFENKTMAMEGTWGDPALDQISVIAKEYQDKFNPNLSEEANILNVINDLDKEITAEYSGAKNADKQAALFAQLLGTGYAYAFMCHRSVEGHKDCAERALAAFHAKNNKRTTGKEGLLAALPSILFNFNKEKSYQTVAQVVAAITPFIVGGKINEGYIVSTLDELLAFIDNAEQYVAENEEAVTNVKTAIDSLVEQLGLTEQFAELLASNPLLKEFYENTEEMLIKTFGDARLALKIVEFVEILRNTFVGRDIAVAVSYAVGEVLKDLGIALAEIVKVAEGVGEKVHEAIMNTPSAISYAIKAIEEALGVVADKVMAALDYAGHVAGEVKDKAIEVSIEALRAIDKAFDWTGDQLKNLVEFIAKTFVKTVNATEEAAKNAAVATYNAVKYVAEEVGNSVDFVLGELSEIPGIIGEAIGDARAFTESVLSWAGKQVSKAFSAVVDVLDSIPGAVKEGAEFVASVIADLIGKAKDAIGDVVSFEKEVAEKIYNAGKSAVEYVADEVSKAIPEVVGFVEDAAKFVSDGVKAYVNFVRETIASIPGAIRDAVDDIGEVASKIFNSLSDFSKEAITTVINVAGEIAGNVEDAVKAGASFIADAVSEIAGNVGDFIGSVIEFFTGNRRVTRGAPVPQEYHGIEALEEFVAKIQETLAKAEDVSLETVAVLLGYVTKVIPAAIQEVYTMAVKGVNEFVITSYEKLASTVMSEVCGFVSSVAPVAMSVYSDLLAALSSAFIAWAPLFK